MNAKPFFKFAGGKTQLLDRLLEYVPAKIDTYYEPFIGGGALFWNLANTPGRFKKAVISDLNEEIIAAYTTVHLSVETLIPQLRKMPCDQEFFLKTRARKTSALGPITMAARFIYLNKTCFNGLYRVNKQGQFNVPFGAVDRTPVICDQDTLRACAAALRGNQVHIKNRSFEHVLKTAKPGDFVYFDPPYLPLSATSMFSSYTKLGFGMQEHTILRDVALALKKRKVKILISNSNALAVRELYAKGFKIEEVNAKRSINSNSDLRGAIKELLIS